MAVGTQAVAATINNSLTDLAVSFRDICTKIQNLSQQVNGQGNGLAYLVSIGYGNTPDAANPGGVSDAQYALNMISYLNTCPQIYFGAASQATAFNFNQELSQLWAGR